MKTRRLSDIDTITVHHWGPGREYTASALDALHRKRFPTAPNPGPQYHYGIFKTGGMWLAHTLHMPEALLYHAGAKGENNNTRSVAVLIAADASTCVPGGALDVLLPLLIGLLETHGLDPDAVRGHREMPGCETACPGALDMTWLRDQLKSYKQRGTFVCEAQT